MAQNYNTKLALSIYNLMKGLLDLTRGHLKTIGVYQVKN